MAAEHENGTSVDPAEPGAAASSNGGGASRLRYDVFLCHNRAEKAVVRDVAEALQLEAGILFFLDEYSIPASVEFMAFIRDAMGNSATCAIFLGPAGWGPTHLEEARLAMELHLQRPDFRIIPVLLPGADETVWSSLFGASGVTLNWVRLTSPTDADGRGRLLEAVQGRFAHRAAGPETLTPYVIRRQAALWERSQRADASLLWSGSLLARAQTLAASNPELVGPSAAPFLAVSARAERRRYQVRLSLAVFAAAAALALSGVALWQRNTALREADVALSRSLAATASRAVGPDRQDERAALLAEQAYRIDERRGAPSSALVTAALNDVLSTAYFSSAYRLPAGMVAEDASPSCAFILAKGAYYAMLGPVIEASGEQAHPRAARLPADVTAAAFDQQGEALWMATRDGTLRLVDAARPERTLRTFPHFTPNARDLSAARDGRHLAATIGNQTLAWLDAPTSRQAQWRIGWSIGAIALAPDGETLLVLDADTGRLGLFEVGGAEPVRIYPGDDSVNAFTFVGAGQHVVVGERGGRAWLWDVGEHGGRTSLGHDADGSADALAATADGSMIAAASGSISPGIRLWKGAGETRAFDEIPGQRSTAMLHLCQRTGFLVSGDLSGGTRYWRLNGTGSTRSARPDAYQHLPLPGRLYGLVRNPLTGEFVVGGDHGVLQAWPSDTLAGPPRVLAPLREAALAHVPNQQRFMADGRNYLLTGHVLQVAVSANGRRLATVDPYGFAVVLPVGPGSAGAPHLVPSPVVEPAFSVALSPSGRRLAVGVTSSQTILHTPRDDGSVLTDIPIGATGEATVRTLRFEDEDHLLVGDDSGRLSRWNLSTEPQRTEIIPSGPAVFAITTLKTGALVIARGQRVEILPPSRGAPMVLSAGVSMPYALSVSDDGANLAAGFEDGTIRIWSTSNLAAEPIVLQPHRDTVRGLAFDATGEVLLSVGDDGAIVRSLVGRHRLAALACQLVWRDLDGSERAEYLRGLHQRDSSCPPNSPR